LGLASTFWVPAGLVRHSETCRPFECLQMKIVSLEMIGNQIQFEREVRSKTFGPTLSCAVFNKASVQKMVAARNDFSHFSATISMSSR